MIRGFDDEQFAAVLESFDEEARGAVTLAQEEAARLEHGQASTGHLLLALLRDDEGTAARALASLDVDLNEVREGVESIGGRGEEGRLERGPFTPRLARVLELAPREAARAGHEEVGTGHLLIGLVREANSVAVRVLSTLGANPADVRREVVGRLRNPSRTGREGPRESYAQESLDRAPQGVEVPEDDPATTFRGWVQALQIHVRCGVSEEERALPQALLVDLAYTYEAKAEDDISATVDYGALLEEAARALEREEFRLLETGARRVGERVLKMFPAVREVAVTVTKPRVPVPRTVSGVSVRATFRR